MLLNFQTFVLILRKPPGARAAASSQLFEDLPPLSSSFPPSSLPFYSFLQRRKLSTRLALLPTLLCPSSKEALLHQCFDFWDIISPRQVFSSHGLFSHPFHASSELRFLLSALSIAMQPHLLISLPLSCFPFLSSLATAHLRFLKSSAVVLKTVRLL